jgi:hypothetical protein
LADFYPVMKFSSLEFDMQLCEDHLDKTNMRSTEIENYFVEYLLVRICAEYEARIVSLVHRRCSRTRDPHLKSFAQQNAKYACRRFSTGEIAGILGKFGGDYKQVFQNEVVTGMARIAWDNIYANRQGVAHRSGAQMSFGDLKRDYRDSLSVLDALVSALKLKPKEIRDLN